MKPSHFITPRTLDEATFYAGGAAIQRDTPPGMATIDKIVIGVSFVGFAVVLVLLVMGR